MSTPSSLGIEEFRAAVRAAAKVYGQREFVVVGRGSLSASMPESAALIRMTKDIDLYPTGEGLDFEVDDIKAIVLHPIDLAYNKLEAGRDKDIVFIAEGLRCGVYQLDALENFIRQGAKEDWRLEMMFTNLQRARKMAGGESE